VIWAVLQQVGGQVTSMLAFLGLAALLRPSDFGLIGMAGAWLAILNAFCETGFGAAIIHRDRVSGDHLSTTFALNLAVGAALTLLGVALSWPAEFYFHAPGLQPVMAALSVGFLVRAFGLTQAALAQRELRFRALALRDLVANFVGGAIGLILALAGYGVWSLVGMSLVSAVVSTAMLWRVAHWRPRRSEVSRKAAADLWPYGSRVLGFNLFKAFSQNTDRLIIGPLLSAHQVGLYTLASRAIIFPVSTFAGALGNYLFPQVSRLQSDRTGLRAVYRAVMIVTLSIVLPGLATVVVLTPVLVALLGDRWRDATPVMQVLALVALAQAIISPVGQLMKGLGRPGWLLRWSIGFTLFTAAALWFGAKWGLMGATVGYAAVHLAALPVILLIGWRLTGVGIAQFLAILWRPALSAIVLAVCAGVAAHYAAGWGRPAVAAIAITVGSLYLAALTRLNPEFAALAVRELRKVRLVAENPTNLAGNGGPG